MTPRTRRKKRSSTEHDHDESPSRAEKKEQTRRALLDGALDALAESSFTALSLREVAKSAHLSPAAFYRHFESMEELGLVLVDESFGSLREELAARRGSTGLPDPAIHASIQALIAYVRRSPEHVRFIARERAGGSPVLRAAIRQEMRVLAGELATDLARSPALDDLGTDDLAVVGALMVTVLLSIAETVLDTPGNRDAEVERLAETELRLVLVGALNWEPGRNG